MDEQERRDILLTSGWEPALIGSKLVHKDICAFFLKMNIACYGSYKHYPMSVAEAWYFYEANQKDK